MSEIEVAECLSCGQIGWSNQYEKTCICEKAELYRPGEKKEEPVNLIMESIIQKIERLTPRAVAVWTLKAQMTKACEELAELQVQLCKCLNGSPTTDANVIDEIADVLIVANQMRETFGTQEVDARILYKLDRLENAIARSEGLR